MIFIVGIFFISSKQKINLNQEVCAYKTFCNVIMSSEGIKMLEVNQYQRSDQVTFIIYANLECTIGKIDECKNDPENLSTTKVKKNVLLDFSFRSMENKHDVYRCKGCRKKFCEFLREHAMKIFNFKKKTLKLLRKKL